VDRDGEGVPVGMITDRDIAVSVVARELDPNLIDVSDVMSRDVATCGENTELAEVIRVMRSRGVRRLPVLDARGSLTGIVAIDDIYGMLSLQMQDLSQAVTRGQVREMSTRVQEAP
jgi:CBS domain-containing protein